MHLGVFIYPGGHHIAAWRHPAMPADGITEFDYYRETGQIAERGLFDLYFVGDALNAREREGRIMGQVAINNLDPVGIVSAVGAVTSRIGLVATLSTTYHEPFAIARKFATLDHLSGGRAGWNVVTTLDAKAALNFSRTAAMEKGLRYERAAEFVRVCKALWDSEGRAIDHAGRFFQVAGPLGLARPPQGWPVLVQAGGSEPGRDFAADIGEAIFTAQGTLEGAQAFRADIHARMAARGRAPDTVKIMPGLSPILGDTEAAAHRREEELAELVHPAVGVWMITEMTGFRLYDHALDAPLPAAEIRAANPALTRNALALVERAERAPVTMPLTLREAARIMARSRVHQSFVGTPGQLARHMADWVARGACEGFNILPPVFPDDLATFVDQVVPELQRMGVYRRAYEGTTLREHLGLDRPPGRAA